MSKQYRANRDSIAARWASAQKSKALRPIESLQEGYTPQLTEALAGLAEVAGKINVVEMVTAINHNDERQKWLQQAMEGHWTTPRLKYNRELLAGIRDKRKVIEETLAPEVRKAIDELPDVVVRETLAKITQSRIDDLLAATEWAGAILRSDVLAAKSAAAEIYGLPNAQLVRQAKQAIENRKAGYVLRQEQTWLNADEQKQLDDRELDAEAVRRIFLWAAEEYGLAETRLVEVDAQVTAPDVRDVSTRGPIVLIPADYETTALKVLALTVHEVGCHWRDSENMQKLLPRLGGGALKPMDEFLYEGHAVAEGCKTTLGATGYFQARRQIYYPVAIQYARRSKANFAETAQMLYELIKSKDEPKKITMSDVWQVTYRVFRGSPRPQAHLGYAYSKDRAYYGGRIFAEELKQCGLEHVLDYGTLSPKDLAVLAHHFQLKPEHGMPYPAEHYQLAKKLAQKLLNGEI